MWCSTKHSRKKRAIAEVNGRQCCKNCLHKYADKRTTKKVLKAYRRFVSEVTAKRKRSCRDSFGSVNKKTALASRRVPALRNRATQAEWNFKGKLEALKIPFKFQRAFIKKGGFVIVDFYIPRKKLVIEIDGGYHNTPEQKGKDTWKERYLLDNYGIQTIRFSNEQAGVISVEELLNTLKEM